MSAEHERQELYKQYLANERLLREKAAADRRASTYLAQAVAASEDIGGRYKQVAPMTITGATPVPQYPRQPEGSPWSQQWPNDPDPLGYSVEDIGEPVGSPAEIEAAQKILDERSAVASSADGGSDDVLVTSLAIEHAEPSTNSSGVGLAPATGGAVPKVGIAAPPSLSQSSAALRTTLATRGPALNEQRSVAGPRPFRRRL
jgi:hypothetical protein